MKGLKEWAVEAANNKNFFNEFDSLKDTQEIINLAKNEGYEFTKEEFDELKMNLISGGHKEDKDLFEALYKNKKIINSIINKF